MILFRCFHSLIVISGVSVTISAQSISSSPDGYHNYSARCDPFYQSYNQSALQRQMEDNNVSTLWLYINRVDLSGWKWMSGEPYVSGGNTVGSDCGVLRANDQIIDGHPCSNRYNYVMCQTENNPVTCPTNASECHVFTSLPYYLVKRPGTWYSASDFCYKNNDILASVPSAQHKATLRTIASEVNGLNVGFIDAWLGLRRTEFKYNISTHSMDHVRQHFWGTQSPCICPQKECVILNGTTDSWQMETCSVQHNFICQPLKPPATAKIITELVTVPSESGSHGVGIAMGIISLLLLLFVLGVVGIICIARSPTQSKKLPPRLLKLLRRCPMIPSERVIEKIKVEYQTAKKKEITQEIWKSLLDNLSKKLATKLPDATEDKIRTVSQLMDDGFGKHSERLTNARIYLLDDISNIIMEWCSGMTPMLAWFRLVPILEDPKYGLRDLIPSLFVDGNCISNMQNTIRGRLISCLTTGQPTIDPRPEDIVRLMKEVFKQEVYPCPDGTLGTHDIQTALDSWWKKQPCEAQSVFAIIDGTKLCTLQLQKVAGDLWRIMLKKIADSLTTEMKTKPEDFCDDVTTLVEEHLGQRHKDNYEGFFHEGSIKKAIENWRKGKPVNDAYVDLLYILRHTSKNLIHANMKLVSDENWKHIIKGLSEYFTKWPEPGKNVLKLMFKESSVHDSGKGFNIKTSPFDTWKGNRTPTQALCDLLVLLRDNEIETKILIKEAYDLEESKITASLNKKDRWPESLDRLDRGLRTAEQKDKIFCQKIDRFLKHIHGGSLPSKNKNGVYKRADIINMFDSWIKNQLYNQQASHKTVFTNLTTLLCNPEYDFPQEVKDSCQFTVEEWISIRDQLSQSINTRNPCQDKTMCQKVRHLQNTIIKPKLPDWRLNCNKASTNLVAEWMKQPSFTHEICSVLQDPGIEPLTSTIRQCLTEDEWNQFVTELSKDLSSAVKSDDETFCSRVMILVGKLTSKDVKHRYFCDQELHKLIDEWGSTQNSETDAWDALKTMCGLAEIQFGDIINEAETGVMPEEDDENKSAEDERLETAQSNEEDSGKDERDQLLESNTTNERSASQPKAAVLQIDDKHSEAPQLNQEDITNDGGKGEAESLLNSNATNEAIPQLLKHGESSEDAPKQDSVVDMQDTSNEAFPRSSQRLPSTTVSQQNLYAPNTAIANVQQQARNKGRHSVV